MSTALAHHHVAAAGGGGGGGGGGGYDTSGPAAGNGVTNGHGGVTPNSNSSNDIKQVQVTTHLVAILLRFDVSFSNRPKEKDAHIRTNAYIHTYVLGMPNFFLNLHIGRLLAIIIQLALSNGHFRRSYHAMPGLCPKMVFRWCF